MQHRVGFIIPSSNTTIEREYSKIFIEDISFHFCRLKLKEITIEELETMENNVEEASELLTDAKVDLICYACTSGSLYKGLTHEEEIVRRIERKTRTKVITTAKSVLSALNRLNVKNISVATPYSSKINLKVREFLENNGFNILKLKGLGIIDNLKVGNISLEDVYNLAKQAYKKGAECLFISCTNLRTLEVIDKLESELNIPVISSNSATLWNVLKNLNFRRKIYNCGILLRNFI
ncbi:aspartate/glutamate racemase family protein [Candidatus Aminicenantes bacterium AC-335-K20]|jgi:maleate isomerase|nr:aspartate/glutamate racemase family protein [SCandidatus Aminicenantes bacterium Aminicenantia_JdfR_composite]MCP2597571.1 aspartate/glutamate racemase family protein [Candidatus Aminicenantes bacterium AC-335-G13]MCP2618413.1 aspartate/glutamate racemase family protein [Candidatus Aminicenantes bacterium AC-335-A11]MCP2619349.1 aspartate/glutamate racemase family protein [Candidatus Aminicenantes bacterium AC-335-K20]